MIQCVNKDLTVAKVIVGQCLFRFKASLQSLLRLIINLVEQCLFCFRVTDDYLKAAMMEIKLELPFSAREDS